MGLHKKQARQVIDQLVLLDQLHDHSSLCEKLHTLLEFIKQRHAFVNRIAVAIYDPTTDIIKTYAHATDGDNPLPLYEAKLSESGSLSSIKDGHKPRVLNNMNPLRFIESEHSKKVTELGFQSSYTVPIYQNDRFLGFVFFNSSMLNAMQHHVVVDLTVIAHLVTLLVTNEINFIATTKGMVHSMATLASHRDLETGQHLIRVSHFSRLIGRGLAKASGLSDEYVEQLFMFAPLHDIGKIAIPDHILCKPGKLTAEEYEIMQTHTVRGKTIIQELQEHLEMLSPQACSVLENIVYHHHESWDGSGYPEGLAGEEIPLEARILMVSDVFDALSSRRVYKERWSVEKSLDYMREKSGIQFDPACVDKFLQQEDEVRSIVERFQECDE